MEPLGFLLHSNFKDCSRKIRQVTSTRGCKNGKPRAALKPGLIRELCAETEARGKKPRNLLPFQSLSLCTKAVGITN